ncbi:hypothetical protein V7O62_02480 [Methanolobus sp. ZRKC2]
MLHKLFKAWLIGKFMKLPLWFLAIMSMALVVRWMIHKCSDLIKVVT